VDVGVGGDRSRRVVIYGDDLEAEQTGPAVGALRAAGFEDVVVLAGGTRAWKDGGMPIESDVRGRRTLVRRPRRLITHPMLWLLGACFGAYVIVIGLIGSAYSSHWAVWVTGGMLLVWAALVVTSFIGGVAEEPTGEEGPGPDQPS